MKSIAILLLIFNFASCQSKIKVKSNQKKQTSCIGLSKEQCAAKQSAEDLTVELTSEVSTTSTISTTSIPVNVAFSASVSDFTADDITVSNGSISNFAGSEGDFTFNLVPTADGDVSVSVAAEMASNEFKTKNKVSNTLSFSFDGTIPTVALSTTAASTTNTTPIPFVAVFSEEVSGFDINDIVIVNGTASNFVASGLTYTFDVVPAANGLVSVDIPAQVSVDSAGNPNSAATHVTRTYDSIFPATTISSSASSSTQTSPIPVTVTFSKGVTGFDITDVVVGNGTAGNFAGTGSNYTFDVTPSANGAVTVNVAGNVASDVGSNFNTAAAQLTRTYDTVSPGIVLSSAAAANINAAFSVTATFSESVTGFALGDITVGNGTASSLTGSGSTYTFTVTPTADGSVTVDVAANVAADAAGNNNTIATQLTRTYDATQPTLTLTSAAAANTSASPITVTATFSESVTGFALGDVTVGNGTAGNLAGSGTTYTFDVTPTIVGAVTINVAAGIASDTAGNTNTAATQLSRNFDNAQPAVALSTAATNPTNSTSFQVTATFSESVTGFVVGDITAGNASISNFAGSGTTYTFDITPSINGVITVDIASGVAADAAGNTNTAATQLSRTSDRIAPTVTLSSSTSANVYTAPFSVTATFSESVTGFALGDITVGNGTASNLSGSGDTYTFDITPTANGSVTIDVAANVAADAAINNNTAATQLSRTFKQLVSIAVTPSTAIYIVAATPQYTATATFNDASTQDVTASSAWSSSDTGVLTINSSSGLASIIGGGTATVTATLSGISGTRAITAYATPPNVTSLTATANFSTVVYLSWTSGGATTSVYSMSYQSGATAPATCSAGTTVSSATIGSATAYYQIGLAASTQYSFRVCAKDTSGNVASGTTVTVTTPAYDHRIFATSTTHNGNFGGLSGADTYCQTTATNAGLSGTWKAVMSDSSRSAASRLLIAGPVVNFNGATIANDKADFFDATIATSVGYNESGVAIAATTTAFTGSNSNGSKSYNACSDWSSSTVGVYGNLGATNSTTSTWITNSSAGGCNSAVRIFCINNQTSISEMTALTGTSGSANGDVNLTIDFPADTTGYSSVVIRRLTSGSAAAAANCSSGTAINTYTTFTDTTYTDATGSNSTYFSYLACVYNAASQLVSVKPLIGVKSMGTTPTHQVFVTAPIYTGNLGGLAGADASCQSAATAAGLSGYWKALLSDSTTSVLSRIPIMGTVSNLNGSTLATSKSDFWDAVVSNAVQYNEYAVADITAAIHVWTGSIASGDRYLGYQCSDWTSNSSGVSGGIGGPTSANANWFAWTSLACNASKSLYCISSEFNASEMTALTGTAGSSSGDIDLTIDFPADTTGYSSVVLKRHTSGLSAANLDCTTGTTIQTYTSFTDTTYTDATGVADTYYSYLACVYNASSQLLTAKPLISVKSKGTTATHQIFATSMTYSGNLGGLSGADAYCQSSATAAGHSGTWKAMISDSSTTAFQRVPVLGKVYNMKGDIVANTKSDLWDLSVGNAVAYTEYGVSMPSATYTWTGTNGYGTRYYPANCSDWTSSSSGVTGLWGGANVANSQFIAWQASACNTLLRLYCVSNQYNYAELVSFTGSEGSSSGDIDLTIDFPASTTGYDSVVLRRISGSSSAAALTCTAGTAIQTYTSFSDTTYTDATGSADTFYSYLACVYNSSSQLISAKPLLAIKSKGVTTAHRVFTTSSTFDGNLGGLAGADAKCQDAANSAGLSGTWKAILSDSTTDVSARLTISGPVYRLDGVKVANDSSDLWDGSIITSTSIQVHEFGLTSNTSTWTGSTSLGVKSASNCSDWSSNSSGVSGTYGSTTNYTGIWIEFNTNTCDTYRSLYCVSQ